MNLGLDDNVVAAAVAAAGTVIGALIQLRITWRKEVSERARGVPMTKKSRRGPVLAVGLLLSARGSLIRDDARSRVTRFDRCRHADALAVGRTRAGTVIVQSYPLQALRGGADLRELRLELTVAQCRRLAI